MIRALAKLSAFILFAYAIYFAALAFLVGDRVFRPERQFLLHQAEVLGKRDPVSLVVLGDSTGVNGVRADQLPNAVSLATPGASTVEMYHAWRNFLATRPAPKCLILAFAYNWRHSREDAFWQLYVRHRYYSLRDLAALYDRSRDLGAYPASAWSKSGFLIRALLHMGYLASMDWPTVQTGLMHGDLAAANRGLRAEVARGKGSFAKLKNATYTQGETEFIDGMQARLFQPFAPSALDEFYFRALLDEASRSGTRVYHFTGPISFLIANEGFREFGKTYFRFLEELYANYPNVEFARVIPLYPAAYLHNANHASFEGASAFTAAIRPRLRCE